MLGIGFPRNRESIQKEGSSTVRVKIRPAKLGGPSVKLWSAFHHAIDVLGIAIPNNTVELDWVGFVVFHCRVKIETRESIPPKSEVTVPLRGGSLAAVLLLSFLPGLGFLRSFMLMRDEKWWSYTIRDSKIDERIVRSKDKGESLEDSGNRSFGHGGGSRDRSVSLVLGDGRRTETCDKNSDRKKLKGFSCWNWIACDGRGTVDNLTLSIQTMGDCAKVGANVRVASRYWFPPYRRYQLEGTVDS